MKALFTTLVFFLVVTAVAHAGTKTFPNSIEAIPVYVVDSATVERQSFSPKSSTSLAHFKALYVIKFHGEGVLDCWTEEADRNYVVQVSWVSETESRLEFFATTTLDPIGNYFENRACPQPSMSQSYEVTLMESTFRNGNERYGQKTYQAGTQGFVRTIDWTTGEVTLKKL